MSNSNTTKEVTVLGELFSGLKTVFNFLIDGFEPKYGKGSLDSRIMNPRDALYGMGE